MEQTTPGYTLERCACGCMKWSVIVAGVDRGLVTYRGRRWAGYGNRATAPPVVQWGFTSKADAIVWVLAQTDEEQANDG